MRSSGYLALGCRDQCWDRIPGRVTDGAGWVTHGDRGPRDDCGFVGSGADSPGERIHLVPIQLVSDRLAQPTVLALRSKECFDA